MHGVWLIFPVDGDQSPWSVLLWLLPKLKLCRSALPYVWCPPGIYGLLQLWTAGAGFKHTGVLLSSSAIPDFSLQMFKSWISFQRTRNWFWLISCKSQQHAGWTLRESQFKHDHSTERQLWVICLISGFTVHAGLGSGTDQGADARLWASCE